MTAKQKAEKRSKLTLRTEPAFLTDEEIIRRFTRATEILLCGLQRIEIEEDILSDFREEEVWKGGPHEKI